MVLIASGRHSAVRLGKRLEMKQTSQKAKQKERNATMKSGNHGAYPIAGRPITGAKQLTLLFVPLDFVFMVLTTLKKVPTYSNLKEKIMKPNQQRV